MPQAKFTRAWRYAERGIKIVEYEPGVEYPDVLPEAIEAARSAGVLDTGEPLRLPETAPKARRVRKPADAT